MVEVKEDFLTDLTSMVQSVECQVWSTAKKKRIIQKNEWNHVGFFFSDVIRRVVVLKAFWWLELMVFEVCSKYGKLNVILSSRWNRLNLLLQQQSNKLIMYFCWCSEHRRQPMICMYTTNMQTATQLMMEEVENNMRITKAIALVHVYVRNAGYRLLCAIWNCNVRIHIDRKCTSME